MPTEARKGVSSDRAMEHPLTAQALIRSKLRGLGFTEEKVHRYASYCKTISEEVEKLKNRNEVIEGLQKIAKVNRLLPEAVAMNLVKSTQALKDSRLSAGVSVASAGISVAKPIIDRLRGMAEHRGIELNECALSLTTVAIDIAGAGTGAVTSVEGIGIPLLVLSVMSTLKDSYGLGKACAP